MRRVVLLPGLDGTGALFGGLLRAAGPGAHLESVTLPPEPLGYSALAARLGSALELTPETVLVAESFSGPLAVLLAAAHPVGALVVCNSFVQAPRPSALALLALSPLFRVRPPEWLLRSWLVGRDAPDELIAAVRTAVGTQSSATLAARVRNVLTVDVAYALAQCSAPITYLRGTEDRLVPESSLAAFARAASRPISIVQIKGPHLLLQTAPHEAWRAIQAVAECAPAA